MSLASERRTKTLFLNIAFALFCAAILFFLFNAPRETTKKLPKDENHSRFHQMGKKAAEKYCGECHDASGVRPLPEGHPPKYRCLFCHKRD